MPGLRPPPDRRPRQTTEQGRPVALFTHDRDGDRDRDGGGPKPPISAHPAFPAIVAAWFAILLGLGSLVLPATLFERAISASGLPSLVAAAGPPLGSTARALIALCAAGGGALAGLVIGRHVARAAPADAVGENATFGLSSRPPISVLDEIDEEGVINGRGLPVTNDRALAIADDDGAEDHLYVAPIAPRQAEATAAPPEPEEAGDANSEREPLSFRPPSMMRGRAAASGGESTPTGEKAELDDLVARLAESLRRRRALQAAVADAPESAARSPALDLPAVVLDVAPAEEAARATADYFGRAVASSAASTDAPARRPFDPPPAESAPPASQDAADSALRAALATLRQASAAAR